MDINPIDNKALQYHYELLDYSFEQIGAVFGVKPGVVEVACENGGWQRQKPNPEKAISLMARKQTFLAKDYVSLEIVLLRKLQETVQYLNTAEPQSASKIKSLVSSFEGLIKQNEILYGRLEEDKEAQEKELQKDELDAELKKALIALSKSGKETKAKPKKKKTKKKEADGKK